jgi:DNA-directed RNA polymerase specialized sigma24 family protein
MLRLHVYARNAVVINEEAFLRHAVHNLSIDQHRHRRSDLYRQVPIDGIHLDIEWMSVNSNLEKLVETCQHLDKIAALLEAASKRTRNVYISHRAGYTYAEIADDMNISRITVRRHISRALQIVMEYRRKSKEEGPGDPGIDGPHVRLGIGAPKAVTVDRGKYDWKRERRHPESLVPESF